MSTQTTTYANGRPIISVTPKPYVTKTSTGTGGTITIKSQDSTGTQTTIIKSGTGGTIRLGGGSSGGSSSQQAQKEEYERMQKIASGVEEAYKTVRGISSGQALQAGRFILDTKLSEAQKKGISKKIQQGYTPQEAIYTALDSTGSLSSRIGGSVADQTERMFYQKKLMDEVKRFEEKGKALGFSSESLSKDFSSYEQQVKEFNEKYGGKELSQKEYDVASKQLKDLQDREKSLLDKAKSFESSVAKYETIERSEAQKRIDAELKKQETLSGIRSTSRQVLDIPTKPGVDLRIGQTIERGLVTPKPVRVEKPRGLEPAKLSSGSGKGKAFATVGELKAQEGVENFLSLQSDVRGALAKGEIGSAFGRTLQEVNITKMLQEGNVLGAAIGVPVQYGGGLLTLGLLGSQEVGKQLKREFLKPGVTAEALQKEYESGFASVNPFIGKLMGGIVSGAASDPVGFGAGLAIGGYSLAKSTGYFTKFTKPQLVKGSPLAIVRDVRIGSGTSFVAKGKGIVLFKETTPLKQFLGKKLPAGLQKVLPTKLKAKITPTVRTTQIDYDLLIKSKSLKPKAWELFGVDKPIGSPYTVQRLVSQERLRGLLAYQKRVGDSLLGTQKGSIQGLVRINKEPFLVKNFFKVKGSMAEVRTAPILKLFSDKGSVVAVKDLGGKIAVFKSKLSLVGDDAFKGSVVAFSKKNLTLFKQQFSGKTGEFLTSGAVVKGKAKSFFDFGKVAKFKQASQVKTAAQARKVIAELRKQGLAVPKELEQMSQGFFLQKAKVVSLSKAKSVPKDFTFKTQQQARAFVKGIKEYNARTRQLEGLAGKGTKTLLDVKAKVAKPITVKAVKAPTTKVLDKAVGEYFNKVYGQTIVLKKTVSPLLFARTGYDIGQEFYSGFARDSLKQRGVEKPVFDVSRDFARTKALTQTLSKQKIGLDTKTLLDSMTSTKTLSDSLTKNLTDTLTKTQTLSDTLTDTATLTDSLTKTQTLSDTKTKTKTLTSTKTLLSLFNLGPVKPTLPKIKLAFFPKFDDETKSGYREKSQAYHAYVKVGNNWKKVTRQPKLLNRAWNKGFDTADNTVARSVTVKPTKKILSGWDEQRQDYKFRQKTARSKIGKQPVLIEKSRHAIDTFGEKQGLSVARYLKRQQTAFDLFKKTTGKKRKGLFL